MAYRIKDIPGMIKTFERAINILKDPDSKTMTLFGALSIIYWEKQSNGVSKCMDLIYDSLGKSLTINGWYFEKTGQKLPILSKKGLNEYCISWAEQIIKDLKGYQKCHTK